MTLSEFDDLVSRRADTAGTGITAPIVRRVISEAFQVLWGLQPHVFADIISRGLAKAEKKARDADKTR